MSDSESKFVPPEETGEAKTPDGFEQPITPEQTQADIRLSLESEILEFLEGKRTELSHEALLLFVPGRLREIAKNPDMIEIQPLRKEPGEISILALEKEYPVVLTDPKAWAKWHQDIEAALKAQEGRNFKINPPAPRSVNRLHARFMTKIDEGELSLSDRILFTAKLRLHPDNPQALFVGDFDGETHQGIGRDFYMNILPSLAKELGLRYIVGQNNVSNITFFTETLARYTKDELKPEFRIRLFSESITNADQNFTIQFLYDEDVEKYVNKDKIKRNADRT